MNITSRGRLCLFGEHSDWAAGKGAAIGRCLVVGVDQGLYAEVDRWNDFRFQYEEQEISVGVDMMELEIVARNPNPFFKYFAAVSYFMFGNCGAIKAKIVGKLLPGVITPTTICLLAVKAYNALYDLKLFPNEIMRIVQSAQKLAMTDFGRIDQAGSFGKIPMLLSFAGPTAVSMDPIVPVKPINMLYVDMNEPRDMDKILKDLHNAHRSDISVREYFEENENIVRQAQSFLAAGDSENLGGLMVYAQKMFKKYLSSHSKELADPWLVNGSASKMYKLLEFKPLKQMIWGGKGTGGFGTVQFITKSEGATTEAIDVITKYFPEMKCFPLKI